jgi:hypothetical protein
MFLRSRGKLLRGLMSLLDRSGEGCLGFVEVGLMFRLLAAGSVILEHLIATI